MISISRCRTTVAAVNHRCASYLPAADQAIFPLPIVAELAALDIRRISNALDVVDRHVFLRPLQQADIVPALFGWLVDRVGTKAPPLLLTGLSTVCVAPILFAFRAVPDPYAAFALVTAGLLIACFYMPISGLVKANLFPPMVRTGVWRRVVLCTGQCDVRRYCRIHRAGRARRACGDRVLLLRGGPSAIAFIASALTPDLGKHGYHYGAGKVDAHIGCRRG